MVSGALLLPSVGSIGEFAKKRIFRIMIPFLIWSVIYNIFPWVSGLMGCELATINEFFAWVTPSHEFGDAMRHVAQIPLTFSYFAVQMWYIYVLIGLYLYIPIFSAWVEKASKKDMQWFLALWSLSLFIPYLREYFSLEVWGECSWNEFGMLYYFAGFNGYLLLGHYMMKYPINISWAKVIAISIPMFTIGYLVTFIGFKDITAVPGQPAALVELFYTYCSPNVALMTIPIAMIAQKLKYNNPTVNKALKSISLCTFGIWMSHYIFLGPIYNLVDSMNIHVMAKMVVSSFVLLGVNWAFVALVLKSKKYGKWIMG